ncbi:hypothetical protein PENTCL1PPCAC_8898, partial [Pristionchus entomophagus]
FCTRSDCATNSLGNLISEAVKVTKTMNWIDDYTRFRSVSSSGQSCCRVDRTRGEYRSVEQLDTMNESDQNRFSTCVNRGENIFLNMTADLRHFTRLLPTMECAMSGGMAHREAISFTPEGEVNAFYLRSFHRTFRNSSDYVNGINLSRLVCDEFKKILVENGYADIEVFPYSMYYVFYDQYLDIASSTTAQLSLTALIGCIVMMVATVSLKTALIVAVNLSSSTLFLVSFMVHMGIELNANRSRVLRPSLLCLRQFRQIGQDRTSERGTRQRGQYG